MVCLCGHFVSLYGHLVCLHPLDCWASANSVIHPWLVGAVRPNRQSSSVLMFLISTHGQNILQRLALAFSSDHTSLAPRSSQHSLCRRHCGGAHPGHKFVSRRTMVPSAIRGMAGPHKAWCLQASGLCHSGWRGSLHCLCTQHFSWTIQTHSSWSTRTTPPAPNQARQMGGSHAEMATTPFSPWICWRSHLWGCKRCIWPLEGCRCRRQWPGAGWWWPLSAAWNSGSSPVWLRTRCTLTQHPSQGCPAQLWIQKSYHWGCNHHFLSSRPGSSHHVWFLCDSAVWCRCSLRQQELWQYRCSHIW